jgi:hypothetical protein
MKSTYSIQIAIGKQTSTTGDGRPGTLPAALWQLIQRGKVEGGLVHRGGTLLLQNLLGLRFSAHDGLAAVTSD